MLSLDSADTGISETGEKTRRVRYARFAVYFHVRTREWVRGLKERDNAGRAARDRERRERQHVRPTSVESDETLLDSAPGISRGNGGLILRRKFLTFRTFERAGEKRLKYYPRDGFPMPEVARDGRISRRMCTRYRPTHSASVTLSAV